MDRHIKEGLEEYLLGAMDPGRQADFERRLGASDEETRKLVTVFRRHSGMIREAYRPPDDVAPPPGFYGRVMDRIQSQRGASFWTLFGEPLFFRRLVFASAALFVLLSLTMVGTINENEEAMLALEAPVGAPMETMAVQEPEQLGAGQEQDRNVILVNLATYQEH